MKLDWLIIGSADRVEELGASLLTKDQKVTSCITTSLDDAVAGATKHAPCDVIVVFVDSMEAEPQSFFQRYKTRRSARPLLIAITSYAGKGTGSVIARLQREGAVRALYDTPALIWETLVPLVITLLEGGGEFEVSGTTKTLKECVPASPEPAESASELLDTPSIALDYLRASMKGVREALRRLEGFLTDLPADKQANLIESVRFIEAEMRTADFGWLSRGALKNAERPRSLETQEMPHALYEKFPINGRHKKLWDIFLQEEGRIFTYEELAEKRGISKASAYTCVSELVRELKLLPDGQDLVRGFDRISGHGCSFTTPSQFLS